MSSNGLLSILHISDFHFTKRKQRDQGIVVDALVADLKALCIGHRKPDVIIFTGDLVQAAGIDLHDDAYDFVIDPVSKVTGCADERIFLVPGNHDLSWAGLEDFSSEHKLWREAATQRDGTAKLNSWYEAGDFKPAIDRKFKNYNDLDTYLRAENKSSRKFKSDFVTIDHIHALNIDIVVINTAAFSAGGNKSFDADERLLAIPEYALLDIEKCLAKDSYRIFAAHHPYAMMNEPTARLLENVINKNAHIHLFGHMHDPQPKSVSGLSGHVISDQAGAIFTARQNSYIGYSHITVDRSNGFAEVNLRSYFDDRKAFDAAIDIISDGKWYSSSDARQHFRKIATPVDEKFLRSHLSGSALASLREEQQLAGGEADIHERFVAPPLLRTFVQTPAGEQGRAEIESPVPFTELLEGDENVILYGVSEYGRTTVLRELRLRLLSDADSLSLPRVPALLDFADIKNNLSAMLRLAKSRASDLPPEHDFESMLKLGHACVMIDDVSFADKRRMAILREFVTTFPKARYIYSSLKSSATAFGAHVNPEMPVRFEFLEIKELKRNDMRNLLNKYEGCSDVEDWLDRLQSEFREINLPFTAANGSIFAEILQEKYKFSPVNRAVLIEQFIDATLRKAAIEQSRRETFDYTNKTDLLAQIASWMAKNENYVPSHEDVRTEMGRYLDSLGLKIRLDDLMNEFLSAKIFINRPDDRISFRYSAVLEYFIALKMVSDQRFKSWVMEEERYLQYTHEIQFYAGKLRNDSGLVDDIGNRYTKIIQSFQSSYGTVNLEAISKINLPKDDDKENIEELYRKITDSPLSKEEKDNELDSEVVHHSGETSQDIVRSKATDIGDELVQCLTLYSGLIKNMELISDADKRKHLSSVWIGWATFLGTAIELAPKLAKERRLRINGVPYEILAPHGMKDAILVRQIMLGLPTVHVKLISNALGTEKLERQLTEPTLNESDEPDVITFLKTGIIADLRLNATPGAVENAFKTFKSSNYLTRSLMTFLGSLRRHDRIKSGHFARIEQSMAGATSVLRGKTAKAQRLEKGRQMTRLNKDRLLIKLKQRNER